MSANLPAVVALSAGVGFIIVWLVFPVGRKAGSFKRNEAASTDGSSSSPPPEDEPEPEWTQEEPSTSQSTYSGVRPRWCDVLLLEPNASPAAIRKAYARLMKGLHPDVAGADENTTRQCALVQEAYREAMQHCGARA